MTIYKKTILLIMLVIIFLLTIGSTPTVDTATEITVTKEPKVELSQTEFEAVDEVEQIEEWVSLGVFTLTAYCSCEKCCGHWALDRPLDQFGNPIVYTASDAVAYANHTIAVDTSVIPWGTEVKIGDTIYTAEDSGSAIKGNRIDVYFQNHQDALNFGKQQSEVFVKGE